ncbi:hypothetical protein GM3708_2783 [Geminocystis sp. NIES-3708]|uniref:hypothetical protein n=1 Tax=Geminocystis sp. NIES-3708 TaxID=1615909 RepID=UPI0005FC5B61|nr:hypothetical protein [Geminocystis sp. NIES-3708]BAQ62377.1 hypothetical protein GM3708_2783 [Geminocystis sp. NIES-3708]
MKKFILTGLVSGMILSSLSPNILAANVHSGSHPSASQIQNATHHFSYDVIGKFPLESLIIQLPQGLTINDVEIVMSNGNKINSQTSISDNKAIVNLGENIKPNTRIYISLRGVKTNGKPHTWQYRLSGKFAGINQEIPLGLTQVRTYY